MVSQGFIGCTLGCLAGGEIEPNAAMLCLLSCYLVEIRDGDDNGGGDDNAGADDDGDDDDDTSTTDGDDANGHRSGGPCGTVNGGDTDAHGDAAS